jgi:hypothetical protein
MQPAYVGGCINSKLFCVVAQQGFFYFVFLIYFEITSFQSRDWRLRLATKNFFQGIKGWIRLWNEVRYDLRKSIQV